jgi:hypothetical protein
VKIEGASVSVTGALALVCAIVAGSAIWLLLTDPATVANAYQQGDAWPVARALAQAVTDALRSLFRYL